MQICWFNLNPKQWTPFVSFFLCAHRFLVFFRLFVRFLSDQTDSLEWKTTCVYKYLSRSKPIAVFTMFRVFFFTWNRRIVEPMSPVRPECAICSNSMSVDVHCGHIGAFFTFRFISVFVNTSKVLFSVLLGFILFTSEAIDVEFGVVFVANSLRKGLNGYTNLHLNPLISNINFSSSRQKEPDLVITSRKNRIRI